MSKPVLLLIANVVVIAGTLGAFAVGKNSTESIDDTSPHIESYDWCKISINEEEDLWKYELRVVIAGVSEERPKVMFDIDEEGPTSNPAEPFWAKREGDKHYLVIPQDDYPPFEKYSLSILNGSVTVSPDYPDVECVPECDEGSQLVGMGMPLETMLQQDHRGFKSITWEGPDANGLYKLTVKGNCTTNSLVTVFYWPNCSQSGIVKATIAVNDKFTVTFNGIALPSHYRIDFECKLSGEAPILATTECTSEGIPQPQSPPVPPGPTGLQ